MHRGFSHYQGGDCVWAVFDEEADGMVSRQDDLVKAVPSNNQHFRELKMLPFSVLPQDALKY